MSYARTIRSNAVETIKYLLDRGAGGINLKDQYSNMPISYTVNHECLPKVAKMFIDKGTIVDSKLIDSAKKLVKKFNRELTDNSKRDEYYKNKERKRNCEEMVKLLESAQKKP